MFVLVQTQTYEGSEGYMRVVSYMTVQYIGKNAMEGKK